MNFRILATYCLFSARMLRAGVILGALIAGAQAADNSWVATSGGQPTGGNWFTGTNWAEGVPNSNYAFVNQTGTGSALISSGTASVDSLFIAQSGTAKVTVGSGGRLSLSSQLNIGAGAGAKGTLSLEGGRVDLNNYAGVGNFGSGTLSLSQNAYLNSTQTVNVSSSTSSSFSTLAMATSSTLNAYSLYVTSSKGGTANVQVTGGSILTTGYGYISALSGGQSTVNLSGSSRWTISQDLHIGAFSGSGTLNVSDSALMEISSFGPVYLGQETADRGAISITNNGRWSGGDIYLGYEGIGTAVVSTGGTMTADALTFGYLPTGSGTMTVSSGGIVNSSMTFYRGTLNILSGGVVNSSSVSMFESSGTASATVSGAGSKWNIVNGLAVGTANLQVDSGGAVSAQTVGIRGTGLVNVTGTGSRLDAGSLRIGVGSSDGAALLVQNGAALNSGTAYIGTEGSGRVTVSGAGSVWTNTNTIVVAQNNSGTLVVQNGGVVAAGAIDSGAYNATILLDAGTLRALSNQTNFLGSGTSAVQLGTGGGAFDSNGFAIGVSSVLSGSGGLTKQGAGTLTLTGSNSYGNTTVSSGTLVVGSGTVGTLGTGSVLNNAALVFGRTDAVTIGSVISGTGSVWQGPSGTLTLTGSNSYSGGTVAGSGAKLNFASEANLGAASGTLTLNGATLHNTSSAVIGQKIVLGAGGATIENGNGFLTLTSAISGSGGLTKTNGNILTLTGSQAYTGATSVQGGMLKIESGSLASSSIDLMVGGTLAFNNGGFVSGNITGTGGAVTRSGTGVTILTGTMSKSGGATVESGTWQLGNGGTTGYSTTAFVINEGATLALNRSDSVAYNTAWSGSGRVVFLGSGTTTLNRDSQFYSGGTTISAGKVIVAGNNGLGSGGVVNNAQLVFSLSGPYTVSNEISGSGSVENTTLFNMLTFTGSNSYTGGTTVTNSGINFATDANLGAISGAVTLNSGTLHNTAALVSDRRIILGAGGGTIQLGSGYLTLNQAISGSGALTKTAGNILTLTGTQTYTGSTSIQGGTLKIEAGTLASPTVDIASGATFLFNNSGSYAGGITGSGTFSRSGAGSTVYTGTATHTGGTVIESGTLQVGSGSAAGSISGAISNSGVLALGNSGTSVFSATIGGTGGVTQVGSGLIILSGSNSYSGPTRLAAGTMQIASLSNIGTSAIQFAGGILQLGGGPVDFSSRFDSTAGQWYRIDTNGQSVTFANALTSAGGSLEKLGLGTLTLTGSNTYNGGTTIRAGTIAFGADASLGAASGTLTLDGGRLHNNADVISARGVTLGAGGGVFDVADGYLTFASGITGSGAMTKTGGNILTVTGAQTYTGSTAIQAGILKIDAGSLASSAVNIASGATLEFQNGGSMSGSLAVAGTLLTSGTTTLSGGVSSFTGTVVIGGQQLRINTTGSSSFDGAITGAGGLALLGSGTVRLNGANSYGGTTSFDGTLIVGTGTVGSLGTGASVVDNGKLIFNRNDNLTVAQNISGSGSVTQNTGGTLTLTGSNSYTGGTTIVGGQVNFSADQNLGAAGGGLTMTNGTLHNTATVVSSRNLLLNGSAATIQLGSGDLTLGSVSGSGQLVKRGAGTLTLTGSQTFAGDTILEDGNLAFAGGSVSTRITSYSVNNNIRFDNVSQFNGTIAGNGVLHVSGTGTTIYSGAQINFTNAGTVVESGTFQIGDGTTNSNIYGNVTVASGATLDLKVANGEITTNHTLSGSGTFIKSGDGTANINGNNGGFTGNVILNAGTVGLARDGALGSGLVTINGGGLRAVGAPRTVTNSLALNGSFTLGRLTNFSGSATLGADITITSANPDFSDPAESVFSGPISGAHSLTFAAGSNPTGAIVLSGSNSYSGGTVVNGGALRIRNNAALGAGSLAVNSGTLDLGGRSVTVAGLSGSAAGVITSGSAGAFTFSSSQSASTTYAGVLQNGSGTMALAKLGSGSLTLSGSNGYSGGTTIQAGTLKAANAFAMGSGTVTVDGGIFIVDAGAAIANDVVLSGGSYQRVVAGNLAHAADATSDFGRETTAEILGGTSGTSLTLNTSFSGTSQALNDGMRVSDVYSLQGTGTNTFVLQLSIDSVTATSYLGWLDEGTGLWVNAVTGNTGGTTFFAGDGAYDPLTDFHLGTYGVDTVNGTVWAVLNHNSEFAIVPEPSSAMLLGLGLLALLRRSRR